jgi:hypothetical protein
MSVSGSAQITDLAQTRYRRAFAQSALISFEFDCRNNQFTRALADQIS